MTTAVEAPGEVVPDELVSSLAPDRPIGGPVRLLVDPVSTASLGAVGYAFGRDIVVANRADARPDTVAGRRLLAHELAHATAAAAATARPTQVADRADATEVHARSAATGASVFRRGRAPTVALGTVCCFGSAEHQALGNAAFAGEQTDIDIGTGGRPDFLSPGDVVALVGDYFASTADLRSMGTTDAGRGQIRWVRWWAIDQYNGVAEPAIPAADKQAARDRYFTLAAGNMSHFSAGGTARTTYESAHEGALRTAFLAGYRQAPGAMTADLTAALTEEAGAQHFLSDMFAAGHVRTERQAIKSWYESHFKGTVDLFVRWMAHEMRTFLVAKHSVGDLFGQVPAEAQLAQLIKQIGGKALEAFSLGDIVSLGLHNADNLGLDVVSDANPTGQLVHGGYHWRAIGDTHLGTSTMSVPGSTPEAMGTRGMVLAAMRASIEDVRAAATYGLSQRPRPVSSPGPEVSVDVGALANAAIAGIKPFRALQYVPRVDLSSSTNASFAWEWGKLNGPAFDAVDKAVKNDVADQLAEKARAQTDANHREAIQHIVDILRRDGIRAVEEAIGHPAR